MIASPPVPNFGRAQGLTSSASLSPSPSWSWFRPYGRIERRDASPARTIIRLSVKIKTPVLIINTYLVCKSVTHVTAYKPYKAHTPWLWLQPHWQTISDWLKISSDLNYSWDNGICLTYYCPCIIPYSVLAALALE